MIGIFFITILGKIDRLRSSRRSFSTIRESVVSGFEYAMKGHGGTGPASKSQFTVAKEKIREVLGRKDLVSSPVLKSTDSGNYIRQFDAGETIGKLPINKGADPTSVITVITDEAGNLVNTFPGTLGRGAQLN